MEKGKFLLLTIIAGILMIGIVSAQEVNVTDLQAQITSLQSQVNNLSNIINLLQIQITNITLIPGIQGIPGINGTNGINGINGTNGVDGVNGTSGKDGINGVNGTNGRNGMRGLQGISGVNGLNGLNGNDGKDGKDGKDGVNGTNGMNGSQGIQGIQGVQGIPGTNATVNLTSINNKIAYFDKVINSLFKFLPSFDVYYNISSNTSTIKEDCTKHKVGISCSSIGNSKYTIFTSCSLGHGTTTSCDVGYCQKKSGILSAKCQNGCDIGSNLCK